MRLICLAAVLGILAGCKPTPVEKQLPGFHAEVRRYFDNLNNEGHGRKDDLRSAQMAAIANPALPQPMGMMYSTYIYKDSGYVAKNFKCRTCGAKLILAVPSNEYLCRACGHSPYKPHALNTDLRKSPCTNCVGADHKPAPPGEDLIGKEALARAEGAAVLDMFEMTQSDPVKPLQAKVRYVRYAWVFDARGTVQLSPKALEKYPVHSDFIPTAGVRSDEVDPLGKVIKHNYHAEGYHRLDAIYVGEIEFVYKGGQLRQLSAAKEEAVRPWKDIRPRNKY